MLTTTATLLQTWLDSAFVYHLALVVALGALSLFARRPAWPDGLNRVAQGVLFGTVAVVGMLNPIVVDEGLFFDGRSVVISLCGLFFGPMAAAVAGGMAVACRVLQGGIGLPTGILVIVGSAAIGVAIYYRRRRHAIPVTTLRLWSFGLVVHAFMLAAMLTLTRHMAADAMIRLFVEITIPILVVYPLATVLLGKILTEQEAREDLLSEAVSGESRYQRQRDVLISLAATATAADQDFATELRRVTEVTARTTDTARVGIWRYTQDRGAIQCVDLYELATGKHSSGVELRAADFPRYFASLAKEDVIVADDAVADPRTSEFSESYLKPLGITSMLDTPIRVGGVLDGVLCLEHVGPRRTWTHDNQNFAIALANLAALAIESSERQRIEAELRLHDAALIATANAAAITDRDGNIVWVNPAFTGLTGYSRSEALGQELWQLLGTESPAPGHHQGPRSQVLAGGVWRGQVTNRRKDGTLYTEELSITPIRGDGGEIDHFVSIHTDISDRIESERRLRDARERLQRAVSAGKVGLWEWELDSGAAQYSDEWCAQLGVDPALLSGTLEEGLSRLHPEELAQARELISSPEARFDPSATFECRMRHEDGQYRWMLCNATLIRDEGGAPLRVIGANVEITELKRLQQEVVQSQKMESIGRLAGGVAHDFNNLLGIIGGYAEIVMDQLAEGDELRKDVAQIKQASDRAANLTRQLLAFSRRQVMRPEVLAVNKVVAEAEKMLRRLIGEDIHFEVRLAGDLGRVLADPGQVEQVLMNLVVNARDAMPTGGTLLVETRNVAVDEAFARQHPGATRGAYVCIRVRDTGTGMDSQTVERIFDPFFTTKEMGKGTGLGLAVVYGIVKQSGGSIWVDSAPGAGTTFDIHFPRVDMDPASSQDDSEAVTAARGDETVLVVEDDATLRALVARVLGDAGYTVRAAASGAEAVLLLRGQLAPVDLLLTDVVMPGMSGRDAADQLRAIQPGLRVLYMSGYTDDVLSQHGVLEEGLHLIFKPFTAAQLTQRIREVIDAA